MVEFVLCLLYFPYSCSFVYSFICVFALLFICSSVYLFFCLFVILFICSSVLLMFFSLFVRMSFCLFVRSSVCLSDYLFWHGTNSIAETKWDFLNRQKSQIRKFKFPSFKSQLRKHRHSLDIKSSFVLLAFLRMNKTFSCFNC